MQSIFAPDFEKSLVFLLHWIWTAMTYMMLSWAPALKIWRFHKLIQKRDKWNQASGQFQSIPYQTKFQYHYHFSAIFCICCVEHLCITWADFCGSAS